MAMSGPLQAGEIARHEKLAWDVYQVGFTKNATVVLDYKHFGSDLKCLAENLRLLHRIIDQALSYLTRDQGVADPDATLRCDRISLMEIIGDYSSTLEECHELVRRNERLMLGKAALSLIEWDSSLQLQADRLHQRIKLHNAKIILFVKPLELDLLTRVQQAITIDPSCSTRRLTGILIPDLDEALNQKRDREISLLPISPGVAQRFYNTAQSNFLDGNGSYLSRLSDAFVLHFENSTKSFARGPGLLEMPPLQRYINLLKCIWLIGKIKQNIAENPPQPNSHWQAYVENLEDQVNIESSRFGRDLIKPDNTIEFPGEEAFSIWPKEDHMDGARRRELGEQVFEGPLKSSGPGITDHVTLLRLFGSNGSKYRLARTSVAESTGTNPPRQQTEIFYFDVASTSIIPLYAINGSTVQELAMMLQFNDTSLRLDFTRMKDVLKFQQALTGFKAWDSYCQHDVLASFVLAGLKKKPVMAWTTVQLWIPKPVLGSLVTTEDVIQNPIDPISFKRPGATMTTETLEVDDPDGKAPWNVQQARFARKPVGESVSSAFAQGKQPPRPSVMAFHEVQSTETASPMSTFASSAPDMTTEHSLRRPPSISSNVSNVAQYGGVEPGQHGTTNEDAVLYHRPLKPRLVLFTKPQNGEDPGAIVSVELDHETVVNPERCNCRRKDKDGASCRIMAIERRKGSKNLEAKRFTPIETEPQSWNLARLIPQRHLPPKSTSPWPTNDETPEWSGLKRISLMFPSAEARAKFGGTPNICQCVNRVSGELLACLRAGHQGYLGEVHEFGRIQGNRYEEQHRDMIVRGVPERAFNTPRIPPSSLKKLLQTRIVDRTDSTEADQPMGADIKGKDVDRQSTVETASIVGDIPHPDAASTSKAPTISQAAGGSKVDSGYASQEHGRTVTKDGQEDQEAQDTSDNRTLYSIDSVMIPPLAMWYLEDFVYCLADDTQAHLGVSKLPESYLAQLPELLKAFTRKLHGESSTNMQREASVFLHKYRRNVVEALGAVQAYDPLDQMSDDEEEETTDYQPFTMATSEIGDWVSSVSEPTDPDSWTNPGGTTFSAESIPDDEGFEEGEEDEITDSVPQTTPPPNLAYYRQFIVNSQAYQWLLLVIKKHALLDMPEQNAMFEIRESIQKHILGQGSLRKLSRQESANTVEMVFTLHWNFPQFIRDQEYSESATEVIDGIVCLVGTWQHAQATTLSEYMEQVWPNTNQYVRRLLKKVLELTQSAGGSDGEVHLVLDQQGDHLGGSYLGYRQAGSGCIMAATGQLEFVTEIGEQLGWLGSALRSSSLSEGVVACSPQVSSFEIDTLKTGAGLSIMASCRFLFPIETNNQVESQEPGFCWASMFRNPVLVTGYPVPHRAKPDTGLEVSLGVMAALMQSRRFVQIGDKIILKGFASMLIATAVADDNIMWHFIYNATGDRISYCDPRLDAIEYEEVRELGLRDVGARRHIIGWCSTVKEYLGHPGSNLTVASSGLSHAPSSIVIDGLNVMGGSRIIGGLNVSLGKKDKPIWLQRNRGSSALLHWVSVQPVIFYDIDDRRAWLADGASALLHLVRASIDRDRNEPAYRSKWKFDGLLAEDVAPRGGSVAAMEVLSNFANLNRPLYLDDLIPNENGGQLVEKFYYFRDRVQEILGDLQVLIDYQAQAAAQDGYWFPHSGQSLMLKKIMGFDFWDVAKPMSPIRQRVHYLEISGHGWVEYIRSIKATTIFGKGFGELLRAGDPSLLCAKWNTMPRGLHYLGASIATLKALQKARNEVALGPGEITSDILWSSRCELFSSCKCLEVSQGSTATPSHHDPVQILLPRKSKRRFDAPKTSVPISLDSLNDDGAVLFGHTWYSFGRRRKDERSIATSQEESTASLSSYDRSQGMLEASTSSSNGELVSSTATSTQGASAEGGTDGSQDALGGRRDEKGRMGKRASWFGVFRSKK